MYCLAGCSRARMLYGHMNKKEYSSKRSRTQHALSSGKHCSFQCRLCFSDTNFILFVEREGRKGVYWRLKVESLLAEACKHHGRFVPIGRMKRRRSEFTLMSIVHICCSHKTQTFRLYFRDKQASTRESQRCLRGPSGCLSNSSNLSFWQWKEEERLL